MYEDPNTGEYVEPIDLRYHTSWNYLMEAVRKISEVGIGGGVTYLLRDSLLKASIDDVYLAVVDFIEWYNKDIESRKNGSRYLNTP